MHGRSVLKVMVKAIESADRLGDLDCVFRIFDCALLKLPQGGHHLGILVFRDNLGVLTGVEDGFP
jgi:hypothetical protein